MVKVQIHRPSYRYLLEARNLSTRELCLRAGLPEIVVYSAIRQGKPLPIDAATKIASVLGVELDKLTGDGVQL